MTIHAHIQGRSSFRVIQETSVEYLYCEAPLAMTWPVTFRANGGDISV
jgi:hypothetical protein